MNKELISGPDLANQIVRVLTRFREDEIVFMADIEKMFYQVQVPVEQQKFLRFLWWEDNNNTEPREFEMCVHVFGGVSSPGCSSIDNEEKYEQMQQEHYGEISTRMTY